MGRVGACVYIYLDGGFGWVGACVYIYLDGGFGSLVSFRCFCSDRQ
jgi:hypothetical protein